jgi:hypothetical protein
MPDLVLPSMEDTLVMQLRLKPNSEQRRAQIHAAFPYLCDASRHVCAPDMTQTHERLLYYMASSRTMLTTEALRHFLLTFADDSKVYILKNRLSFHPFNTKKPVSTIKKNVRSPIDKAKIAAKVAPALTANKVIVMELSMKKSSSGHSLTAVLYPTSSKANQVAAVIIDSNAPHSYTTLNRASVVLHEIFKPTLLRAGKDPVMQVKFWSPEGMMTMGPQKAAGDAWCQTLKYFLEKQGVSKSVTQSTLHKMYRKVGANDTAFVHKILKKFAHSSTDGQVLLHSAISELAWPLGTCQWWSLWFLFCIACYPEKDLGTVYNEAVTVLTRHLAQPVSDYNKGRTMLRFIVRFAMQILSYQDVQYDAFRYNVTINGRVSMENVPPGFKNTPVPAYALDM